MITGSFPIFDARVYAGDVPDLGWLRCFSPQGPDLLTQGEPDAAKIKTCTARREAVGAPLIMIDLADSGLPFVSKTTPSTILSVGWRLAHVVACWKRWAPASKVGLFGIPANSDLYPLMPAWRRGLHSTPDAKLWQLCSEALAPAVSLCDCVCPALYAGIDGPDDWEDWAMIQVGEARRFGKPVYPVLSPRFVGRVVNVDLAGGYTEYPALAWAPIDLDFWRRMVQVAKTIGDGLVIWGGGYTGDSAKKLAWGPNDDAWAKVVNE